MLNGNRGKKAMFLHRNLSRDNLKNFFRPAFLEEAFIF